MIRTGALVWIALVAGAAATDFSISFEVQRLHDRLGKVTRDVSGERDTIRVLRAEWAYLTQPARLRAMAEAYTELAPIRSDQLVASPAIAALAIPLRDPAVPAPRFRGTEGGPDAGPGPSGTEPGPPLFVAMVEVPGFGPAPVPSWGTPPDVAETDDPAADIQLAAVPAPAVTSAPPAPIGPSPGAVAASPAPPAIAPPAAPPATPPALSPPMASPPAALPAPEDDPIGALLVSFQAED